jgi:hemerythrin-like domain-containing protein
MGVNMDIVDYLKWQHDTLSRQLNFLKELLESNEINEAAGITEAILMLKISLDDHASIEEKILFPVLHKKWKTEMGPDRIMQFEHSEIEQILFDLRRAKDARRVRIEAEKFIEFLRDHINKEEKLIFPMARTLIRKPILKLMLEKVVAQKKAKKNDEISKT